MHAHVRLDRAGGRCLDESNRCAASAHRDNEQVARLDYSQPPTNRRGFAGITEFTAEPGHGFRISFYHWPDRYLMAANLFHRLGSTICDVTVQPPYNICSHAADV